MTAAKMHADEPDIDPALVRDLISEQFPQWARLPIESVASSGTDNAMYRLGGNMAVRLPRRHEAAQMIEKEARWLPTLGAHLPLAIPHPLAKGHPARGFPFHERVRQEERIHLVEIDVDYERARNVAHVAYGFHRTALDLADYTPEAVGKGAIDCDSGLISVWSMAQGEEPVPLGGLCPGEPDPASIVLACARR